MSLFSNAINSESSLFSSVNQGNIDNQVDSKLQNRQEKFEEQTNYDDIKQKVMHEEITEGQDFRNNIIAQRRLKKKIHSEITENLKNKLTISLELYNQCENMEVQPCEFPNIVQSFRTEEISQKYKGLVGIRKMIAFQSDPPIQELIEMGIVGNLIDLLGNSPAEFQYESLWCLTNIATGTSDQVNSIIVKGGIPKIIALIDSNIEELKSQAIWAIGNLASDSQKSRDLLLKEKAFDKILAILATTTNVNLIKNCCWAISNFCRVNPFPPYEEMRKCIQLLGSALMTVPQEKDFLSDITFVLSYMTENYKESIQEIIKLDLLKNIMKLLDVDIPQVQVSAIRICGNFASGDANQTQFLIDKGVLNYLKNTLFSNKKTIRKESAWIISNIAAGTQKQIETLIENDFLPELKKVIDKDDSEIAKEAIWAVCNLTSIEKPELLEKLFQQNILEIICSFLKLEDAKHLAVSIEAFCNLLAYGKKNAKDGVNMVVREVEKMGMFNVLEHLQYHPVELVYEKTLKMLETYFETENNENTPY